MMLKTFVIACLSVVVLASGVFAQTTPPAPNPNQGIFDQLSPGNQKIAQALFDAERSNSTATTAKPLSRDDIAAMKRDGKGWGEVFKEMKQQGLVDAKNLGQIVRQESGKASLTDRKDIAADRRDIKEDKQDIKKDRQDLRNDLRDVREDRRELRQDRQMRKASSGTSITTGSGKTFVAGTRVQPEHGGLNAGRLGDDHGRSGSDSGRLNTFGGPGRDYSSGGAGAGNMSHGGRGRN